MSQFKVVTSSSYLRWRYYSIYNIGLLISLLVTIVPCASNAEPSIQWNTCPDADTDGFQCGLLTTPLNYEEPDGVQIKVALYRLRNNVTSDKYQGIVLMNPGGPGSSGLSLILRVLALPLPVMLSYDWIAFDPRGVERSQPALSCIPKYKQGPRPDFFARDEDEEEYWMQKAQDYADACARNHSDILPFMRTTDVVQDMDNIRIALGESKINFIGYSYGTYLGQVYATMYPNRVRRMILDAIVDPRHVWYQLNMNQNPGIDRNIILWFDWLAKYDSYYKLGNTRCQVQQKWNNVLEALRTEPIHGKIGPSDWLDSFLLLAYSQSTWALLGTAFANWYVHKNPQMLLTITGNGSEPISDNSYAVYLSVICTDAKWPKGWSTWEKPQWWSYERAPISTWLNARMNWPCQYWPTPSGTPVNVMGRKFHRILLIGATLDAATPIEGAFEVRKRFPQASLITVTNDPSHGTAMSGNECVDDLVVKYLQSGELPRRKLGNQADVICPQPADPQPTQAKSYTEEEIKRITSKKNHII